jgi:hypothetical protein
MTTSPIPVSDVADHAKLRALLNRPSWTLFPPAAQAKEAGNLISHQRCLAILRNVEIFTVGHVCMKTEMELLKYRFFGRRALEYLKQCVASHSLKLGMTFGPELHDQRIDHQCIYWYDTNSGISPRANLRFFFQDLKRTDRARIITSLMAGGVYVAYPYNSSPGHSLNISFARQFLLFTEADLLKFAHVKPRHIEYIKQRLQELGGYTLWKYR